jgi:hypothetical protein
MTQAQSVDSPTQIGDVSIVRFEDKFQLTVSRNRRLKTKISFDLEEATALRLLLDEWIEKVVTLSLF